jgi:hypothetical protein
MIKVRRTLKIVRCLNYESARATKTVARRIGHDFYRSLKALSPPGMLSISLTPETMVDYTVEDG